MITDRAVEIVSVQQYSIGGGLSFELLVSAVVSEMPAVLRSTAVASCPVYVLVA